MKPTVGMRFEHARVINEDRSPMVFIVTRIARGVVYYRPEGGGGSQCCAVENFPKWCRSRNP